jgi:integrase
MAAGRPLATAREPATVTVAVIRGLLLDTNAVAAQRASRPPPTVTPHCCTRRQRPAELSGVTVHGLRHFFASPLIRHGESVKTLQARLGHAGAAETLDTYSHLWPDSDDRTRAAVDSVLGRIADSVRTDVRP